MASLYITADQVGIQTGGGIVTRQESDALKQLGNCLVLDRDEILQGRTLMTFDPFDWDKRTLQRIRKDRIYTDFAHFYAGTFTETINYLKSTGTRITYTAAAHDIEVSKREHESLGIPYNYPHLTDPEQWKRYVNGYLAADVLICPSRHSADVKRKYGRTGRIEIIPHGCELSETVAPPPNVFTVGYLGAVGPDKGLRYLLSAWKKLNYRDAILKIAGSQSISPFVQQLIQVFGGGNINLMGWINNVSDFYNGISLYCQSSASEGFGIEILEAMAHARPVVCSTGAGAADVVPGGSCFVCKPADVDSLAEAIDTMKKRTRDQMGIAGERCRQEASKYTWDKIRARYADIWRTLV